MRINSPDSLLWEVEAAHIVPNSSMGRDDIWNGMALCRLHHWAFDVGWLTLQNDYTILVSRQVNHLPFNLAEWESMNLLGFFQAKAQKLICQRIVNFIPYRNAITWHRQNKFYS